MIIENEKKKKFKLIFYISILKRRTPKYFLFSKESSLHKKKIHLTDLNKQIHEEIKNNKNSKKSIRVELCILI